MIDILVANKQKLEAELQERVTSFFEANRKAIPASVSIKMALVNSANESGLSTIRISVKDILAPAQH